jgi:uncharacterized protein
VVVFIGATRGQWIRTLPIISLTLEIRLTACRSLKEKRRRLSGLRDRFGRNPGLALSETGYHDRQDSAQWTVVAIGADIGRLQTQLHNVEKYIHEHIDGYVTKSWLDTLS